VAAGAAEDQGATRLPVTQIWMRPRTRSRLALQRRDQDDSSPGMDATA